MSDKTDVTGTQNGPQGPTLEDVVDVLARANRGILQLEKMVLALENLVTAFFTILFLYLILKGRP